MTDNTIKTADGIEVYKHDIYYFADEYIEKELDGDIDKVRESSAAMFLYISDRIPKPSHENINLLDEIFDIYVRICAKYRILPTLEMFSFLIKTHRSVFTDWKSGTYRSSTTAYSVTVKRWFDTCKSFVVDRLSNQYGTNANLIFVAKSAYNMRETAPIPTPDTNERHVLTADQLPRLDGSGEIVGLVEDKGESTLPRLGEN